MGNQDDITNAVKAVILFIIVPTCRHIGGEVDFIILC